VIRALSQIVTILRHYKRNTGENKMKRLLLVISLLCFATSCYSADVKFAWDYTQGADSATGFELRLSSVAGGATVMTQDCPSVVLLECTIPAIAKGNWFATVRAYNVDSVTKNYSGPSNEVAFQITGNPNDPTNIRIKK
jgi:hypothetical protein